MARTRGPLSMKFHGIAVGLAALLLVVMSWLSVCGLRISGDIHKSDVTALSGHAFVVSLAPPPMMLRWRSDTNLSPRRSDLVVLEGGRALPVPHALHDDIAKIGRGRFSHWGDKAVIFFSTSDNSDPRWNDRVYTYEGSVFLPAWAWFSCVALLLLVFRWEAGSEWRHVLLRVADRAILAIRRAADRWHLLFAAVSSVVLAISIAIAIFALSGMTKTQKLLPQMIVAAGSSAYIVQLGPDKRGLQFAGNVNGWTSRSNLMVLENGHPLAFRNVPHADIAAEGAGRYMHWADTLVFSTSDNTDPRRNGRTYSIEGRAVPSVLWLWGAISAAVLAGLFLWASGRKVPRDSAPFFSPTRIGAGFLILVAALAVSDQATADRVVFTLKEAWLQISDLFPMLVVFAAGFRLAWRGWRGVWDWRLVVELGGWYCLRRILDAPDAVPLAVGPIDIGAILAGALCAAVLRQITGASAQDWSSERRQRAFRSFTLLFVILTFIHLAPDVFENWDSSGWMDSYSYDASALAIASGINVEGSSFHMPLYQFGLAAVYRLFGHFFWVQQIINLFLALASTALLCAAIWNFTRRLTPVFVVGLLAMSSEQIYAYTYFTQIESWFIPAVSFAIWTLSRYWRRPAFGEAILIGIALAIMVNLRVQGLPLAVFFALTPLLFAQIPVINRLRHVGIVGVVVMVSVTPWTIRNYLIEGRISPVSGQSSVQTAVLNDPRIGLYGVRWNENYNQLADQWITDYPDERERHVAQNEFFRKRLINDFPWFLDAAPWRLAAYYGFLANTVFDPGHQIPKRLSVGEGYDLGYFHFPLPTLMLLVLSGVGLAALPWRWPHLVLAGGILAAGGINLLVGQSEPRLSYPALLLHMQLGALAFGSLWREEERAPVREAAVLWRRDSFVAAAAALASMFVLSGLHNVPRAIMEPAVIIDPTAIVDSGLPDLGEFIAQPAGEESSKGIGRRIYFEGVASNHMAPPKYVQGVNVPAFAMKRNGEIYFYVFWKNSAGKVSFLGVSYFGAKATRPIRAGDRIRATGTLLHVRHPGELAFDAWIRVDAVDVDPNTSRVR